MLKDLVGNIVDIVMNNYTIAYIRVRKVNGNAQ